MAVAGAGALVARTGIRRAGPGIRSAVPDGGHRPIGSIARAKGPAPDRLARGRRGRRVIARPVGADARARAPEPSTAVRQAPDRCEHHRRPTGHGTAPTGIGVANTTKSTAAARWPSRSRSARSAPLPAGDPGSSSASPMGRTSRSTPVCTHAGCTVEWSPATRHWSAMHRAVSMRAWSAAVVGPPRAVGIDPIVVDPTTGRSSSGLNRISQSPSAEPLGPRSRRDPRVGRPAQTPAPRDMESRTTVRAGTGPPATTATSRSERRFQGQTCAPGSLRLGSLPKPPDEPRSRFGQPAAVRLPRSRLRAVQVCRRIAARAPPSRERSVAAPRGGVVQGAHGRSIVGAPKIALARIRTGTDSEYRSPKYMTLTSASRCRSRHRVRTDIERDRLLVARSDREALGPGVMLDQRLVRAQDLGLARISLAARLRTATSSVPPHRRHVISRLTTSSVSSPRGRDGRPRGTRVRIGDDAPVRDRALDGHSNATTGRAGRLDREAVSSPVGR